MFTSRKFLLPLQINSYTHVHHVCKILALQIENHTQQNQLIKCAIHNQLCIIAKNLCLGIFFTTSNQCIYTCRSCLQNISFVNLKPHPAELIN